MGASSWIPTVAVAAALVGVGGYTMMKGDCDTCIVSSIFGTSGDAKTTTVAAEAPAEPKGCCPLTSKADAVLASSEISDANVFVASGEMETGTYEDGATCSLSAEACEVKAECEMAADETCDEPCEKTESEQLAARETEQPGDG